MYSLFLLATYGTIQLWEASDQALNRLIGYDATPTIISQKIRRGVTSTVYVNSWST